MSKFTFTIGVCFTSCVLGPCLAQAAGQQAYNSKREQQAYNNKIKVAANDFGAACREANQLVERQAKAEKDARKKAAKTFVFGMKEGGSTYGLGQTALQIKEDPAIDAKVMSDAYAKIRAALPEALTPADEIRLLAAQLALEERGGCRASRERVLARLTSRPTEKDAVNAAMSAMKRLKEYTAILAFADQVVAANKANASLSALGLGWRWFAAYMLKDEALRAATKAQVDALPLTDDNIANTYMVLLGYPASSDEADFKRLIDHADQIKARRYLSWLYTELLRGRCSACDYDGIKKWQPKMAQYGDTHASFVMSAEAMIRMRCWRDAADYARKAYDLRPTNADNQLRLARTLLACGKRDEAAKFARDYAANETAKPMQRFAGRVLAVIASAKEPKDVTTGILALEQDSGAKDGREFADWVFNGTFQAFEPLMTHEHAKWLLAARAAALSLMREEERVTHTVRFRASAPRTAALAEAEGLFDGGWFSKYACENRFAPYATYDWTSRGNVLKNLACEPKPDLVGVKGEGRGAELIAVADEVGVHVYTRFRDPAAAKFRLGEVNGAGYEFSVWTGEGGWNQVFTRTDDVSDRNEVTWDALDYGHPSTFGSIVTDSTTTDKAFLFHTFIPWTHVYDRIPKDGDTWFTVMCASMPAGTFIVGGGEVHEFGRGLRLKFAFSDDETRIIRRALVRQAAGRFLRFKSVWKNIDRWSDNVLGDPDFAKHVVVPWSEKVGRAAASLLSREDADVTDADSAACEAYLADWLDPQLRLNDMRVAWLKARIFER